MKRLEPQAVISAASCSVFFGARLLPMEQPE